MQAWSTENPVQILSKGGGGDSPDLWRGRPEARQGVRGGGVCRQPAQPRYPGGGGGGGEKRSVTSVREDSVGWKELKRVDTHAVNHMDLPRRRRGGPSTQWSREAVRGLAHMGAAGDACRPDGAFCAENSTGPVPFIVLNVCMNICTVHVLSER
jgi:hypothetical protein